MEKLDQELKEINTNADALLKNFNELTELRYNLSMTQNFFEQARPEAANLLENNTTGELDFNEQNVTTASSGMKLGFVSGVILRERMASFERMLWRVCRGNIFLKQAEIPELIEDPVSVCFFSLLFCFLSKFVCCCFREKKFINRCLLFSFKVNN